MSIKVYCDGCDGELPRAGVGFNRIMVAAEDGYGNVRQEIYELCDPCLAVARFNFNPTMWPRKQHVWPRSRVPA